MWKNILITALVVIVIGVSLSNSYKCAKLELENTQLKLEHNTLVTILKCENDLLITEINELKDLLNEKTNTIDSLKLVKQKVIIEKEFVVSTNLTEGVVLLQQNLQWEKQ